MAQIHQQLGVRSQPLVSDTTARWFELYDGMVMENNTNLEVQLANAPTTQEVYNLMQQFISQWINEAPTPWALVVWDPGRDPDPKANIWPVPEDFSYSHPQLESAGTDGLPLGDLNWFPSACRTTWPTGMPTSRPSRKWPVGRPSSRSIRCWLRVKTV